MKELLLYRVLEASAYVTIISTFLIIIIIIMNVETSKHDELWTTRGRVMMNVDIETLTMVIADQTSAVVVSVDYQ